MPFTLDPKCAAALAALMGPNGPPPKPPVGDILTRRERTAQFFEVLATAQPNPSSFPDVETKELYTTTSDGHKLLLRWFTKKYALAPGTASSTGSSAILYAHGGGMICLSIKDYDQIIKRYVSLTGVSFLAPEYRLAPEFPAPIPVMDTYAGLQYLQSNAAALGIDPTRIGVMGDSAGGGIATSVAHYAKLQDGPKLAKQILIYPMLDDRSTVEDEELTPYLVWTVDDNLTGWGALLGKRRGGEDVKVTEAAGRMTVQEARGLPACYIDVGELDLFRDEDLEYARKLGQAGVSTELHVIPGMPHGFDGIVPEAAATQAVYARRVDAIKSI